MEDKGPLDFPDGFHYNIGITVEPIFLHTSDIVKFKECRIAWDLSSVLRRSYRPKIAAIPLGFGTSIHSGLQFYRDPRMESFPTEVKEDLGHVHFLKALKAMYGDNPELYAELRDLGRGMLAHYYMWRERVNNKVIAVEIPFEVAIRDPQGEQLHFDGRPVFYKGKLDVLEEDENGDYWICDYKTVGRWEDEENLYPWLQRGEQVTGYAWALRAALGIAVVGVVYEQIYKGVPTKPAMLQRPYKGRWLSTNKNQDTTYDLFLEAIKETGEPVEAYADILQWLREGGKQYFRRIEVRKSTAELEYFGRELYHVALDMLTDPHIYASPGKWACKYCDYKSPCEQVMRGEDPEFTLVNEYMKVKEHYVDYGSVDSD